MPDLRVTGGPVFKGLSDFGSRMRYVIGGNLRQAEELIARKQLTDCVAIDNPDALRGLHGSDVILTGTFIARQDVQSFYDVLKQTGATYRFLA